jgi:integrase
LRGLKSRMRATGPYLQSVTPAPDPYWVPSEPRIMVLEPKILCCSLALSTMRACKQFRKRTGNSRNTKPGRPNPYRVVCGSNALLRTGVTLALNTALRKNEIRTLRWGHIDLFNRTLAVGRSKTDGSSGRVIPLNRVAYAALASWMGRFPKAHPAHYVFPACEDARIDCATPNADKIDPSRPVKSWRTAWRRALADAGMQIRFHDLRHCCLTKLAESQASE